MISFSKKVYGLDTQILIVGGIEPYSSVNNVKEFILSMSTGLNMKTAKDRLFRTADIEV